jgi:hypothetical protein
LLWRLVLEVLEIRKRQEDRAGDNNSGDNESDDQSGGRIIALGAYDGGCHMVWMKK